jgi:hypothetical protein
MTISELLASQRGWGRIRARKFLTPLLVGESKQLGTLTERQRRLVARELVKRSASGSRETSVRERDQGEPSHA